MFLSSLLVLISYLQISYTEYNFQQVLSPGKLPFNQKLDSQDYGDYPDYGSQIAPGDLEGPFHQTLSTEVRDVLQIRSEHIRTFNFTPVNFPAENGPQLGQVTAVSLDPQGNVVIFHRGDRVWNINSFDSEGVFKSKGEGPIQQNTIYVYNSTTGEIIQEWGKNLFYMPHGLTIDRKNNLWITDVALHQVLKFPPPVGNKPRSTEPVLTLGVKFVPGNDEKHFCKPTSIAIMSANGDFFVADGYCNNRIMKYNRDGQFILQWGRPPLTGSTSEMGITSPPPNNVLFVPHALALIEDLGWLCVADRENGRIQCFSTNGTFVMTYSSRMLGSEIYGIAYSPAQGGMLLVVNGNVNTGDKSPPAVPVTGFALSLPKGLPLSQFGSFSTPHAIASSADGSAAYVVEIGPNKIHKFVAQDIEIPAPVAAEIIEPAPPKITKTRNATTTLPPHLQFSDYESTLPKSSPIGTVIAVCLSIVAVVSLVAISAFYRLHKRGKNREESRELDYYLLEREPPE